MIVRIQRKQFGIHFVRILFTSQRSAGRVIQWSRTHGPCDPEFFSKPGFVEALRSIRVEVQLLEPEDIPINIVPPPVNGDHRYPRLHFKGTGVRAISGMQDDTVVNGHVDRYLDGAIQWTFVSPVLDL